MSKFVHHVMLHVMLGGWRAGPVYRALEALETQNLVSLVASNFPDVFVFPTVQASPSSNLPAVPGILGLGPSSGSAVYRSLNNQTQGDTVVNRIFQQNVSSLNILTVLLERSNDPTEKYPGDITVGEIIPWMENITTEPKVPVTNDPKANSVDQHWQVLLDSNGIVGPDGKPIQVQATVQGSSSYSSGYFEP